MRFFDQVLSSLSSSKIKPYEDINVVHTTCRICILCKHIGRVGFLPNERLSALLGIGIFISLNLHVPSRLQFDATLLNFQIRIRLSINEL